MESYEYAKIAAASAIRDADAAKIIETLGGHLAEEHGYPLEGISAVHYHLIQKYNWLPRDVRSLSIEDMKLACAAELALMKPTEDLLDFQQVLSIASCNVVATLIRPS